MAGYPCCCGGTTTRPCTTCIGCNACAPPYMDYLVANLGTAFFGCGGAGCSGLNALYRLPFLESAGDTTVFDGAVSYCRWELTFAPATCNVDRIWLQVQRIVGPGLVSVYNISSTMTRDGVSQIPVVNFNKAAATVPAECEFSSYDLTPVNVGECDAEAVLGGTPATCKITGVFE